MSDYEPSQDCFPPKWGLDSNLQESDQDINKLHLMKEGFKIVDKQGIVYAGLQFEEEKKSLSEQTQEVLVAGGKVVGVAAVQVAEASKWGFTKMIGFIQKAGNQIIGNIQGLQDTYKKYKEQQQQQQQDDNKSKIQENWEIVISDNTPQEEIDQIKQQIEEDGGTLKITRVQQAVHLQKMNSNERIIQLQESSMSFQVFVENQQSRIRQQQEFGLLDSDNIDLRGAIPGIEDSENFDMIKKQQDEEVKNREFDWSRIYHFNPNQQQQQQQQQQQMNQYEQNPNEMQQYPNQNDQHVYQINNILNNNQPNPMFNVNQYDNFMKVNIPQINPNQDFSNQQNNNMQYDQNNQQENNEIYLGYPNYNYNNQQQNYNQYQYQYPQQEQQQNNNQYQQNNNDNNNNQYYYQNNQQNNQNQNNNNNINSNNNQNNNYQYQSDRQQLEEPMAN